MQKNVASFSYFKTVQASARLGALVRSDIRIPHEILYGLLAHSHDLASEQQKAVDSATETLVEADKKSSIDPRDCLDFLCVPSLGSWSLSRFRGDIR